MYAPKFTPQNTPPTGNRPLQPRPAAGYCPENTVPPYGTPGAPLSAPPGALSPGPGVIPTGIPNCTNPGVYQLPVPMPYQQVYVGLQQPMAYPGVGYGNPGESPPLLGPLSYFPPSGPSSAPTNVAAAAAAAAAPSSPHIRIDAPALGRRTKVSWACDKCRRRKTRCDMDENRESCTPCARAGVPCTFLRTQLRRGPSKKRSTSTLAPVPAGLRQRSRSDPVYEIIRPQVHHTNKEKSTGLPALVEAASLEPYAREHAQAQGQKPPTPPSPSAEVIGDVSYETLMLYYKLVHPLFPLLPDKVRELTGLIEQAGPAGDRLIDALNLAVMKATNSGPPNKASSVPPGGIGASSSNGGANGGATKEAAGGPVAPLSPSLGAVGEKKYGSVAAAQEAHLIALLLTYLYTLDAAWLGAGVAAATALLRESSSTRTYQLVALLVVLDRLHCAVNHTLSLVPESLLRYAERSDRMRSMLAFFSPSPKSRHPPLKQENLRELGNVVLATLDAEKAKSALTACIPDKQMQENGFVQHILRSA